MSSSESTILIIYQIAVIITSIITIFKLLWKRIGRMFWPEKFVDNKVDKLQDLEYDRFNELEQKFDIIIEKIDKLK